MARLIPPKSPNLLIAPTEYEARYQDQLNGVQRLYYNTIDNFNQLVGERVTTDGILFPDGTEQTTAWNPSYVEAFDRTASIAIPNTPTLLIPNSFTPSTAVGITYNTSTGVFTFQYEGVYSLAITLNILATNANQIAYVYAQKNVGAGWVNTTNSGKEYKLTNGVTTQFTTPQAVYRAAGEQVRYYIYSNGTTASLVTQTLPGITPAVYVPAIRIQYSGG